MKDVQLFSPPIQYLIRNKIFDLEKVFSVPYFLSNILTWSKDNSYKIEM